LLIALSGCSGSTETNDDANAGNGSSFPDASSDCEGCQYALRGLSRPNRLWVAADHLYVEDWLAAKLIRLPLEGGSSEVVSEGVVPQTFAVTPTHLYFVAPDPIDDGSRIIYRVSHANGEREQVARYADSGEIAIGLTDGEPVLKGKAPSGSGALMTVGSDGEKTTVREWSSSASPASSCISVLEDGELFWCDPEDGVWSAPNLSDPGMHLKTGWVAGELDVTTSGLLVASSPVGGHSIYLREPGGTLTQVATSADPIGSPRYFVGGGVVWVKSGVHFTDDDGQTSLLADSDGKLSTPSEGISVSSDHVFFTGHRGSEPWSVYRIPVPR
jgi:hypothetical protein